MKLFIATVLILCAYTLIYVGVGHYWSTITAQYTGS
jgi:NADH:ubiquinone oxidoreductase subunit K